MQKLYSYLTYTDKLLDVFLLLLAVILSEFHEKPRRKYWVTEESTWKKFCEGHHFFDCTSFFLCRFLSVFWSTRILRRKGNFSLGNGGESGTLLPPQPPSPPPPQCLQACYLQLLITQYPQGMCKNVWQFI